MWSRPALVWSGTSSQQGNQTAEAIPLYVIISVECSFFFSFFFWWGEPPSFSGLTDKPRSMEKKAKGAPIVPYGTFCGAIDG